MLNREALQKKVEEQILDSYEALYRLAFTYVHQEQDALDIVQESVYRAMKHASSVREEQYIETWLWRITMNTAIDFIRKNRRELVQEEFPEAGVEDQYQDFDTLEALEVLSEKERAVVVLRFFEDRQIREVAEILQENTNTVKTILYRSLRKLKIELTREELLYEG
ncbi:MAG: sigma-70 family RNA polymerase sigma factor [Lachnospiraceae bacterium]|nr:sigma-70 family RNA polymerase sigma factor [Lachnospiraceae bacterium]MCI8995275.1 sigma-70 family RNA polymerase sigma factor [Lachnospiraceae bacterium]MCI9133567.1 sigma-70 family RNA polymerase sigma factor [Lachnospiraceae bacterium]